MYGKIAESRLLDIEVYKDKELLYKGKIENAPEKIKNTNYQSVTINNGCVIYYV